MCRCALQAANLTSFFEDPTLNATIFAPDNGAFIAALRTYGITATQLLSNKAVLIKVCPQHV